MEAYSDDLRQRVLAAIDAGKGSVAEVAAQFQVSPAWVRRLVQRRRETGSAASPRRPRKLDPSQLHKLAQLVGQNPNATLADLRARLGADVATSTIWRALRDLGLTLKQRRQP